MPGITGSVLGLVRTVSVYCHRVKSLNLQVVSVWQKIRINYLHRSLPQDTLACCWDDKQPRNRQTFPVFPMAQQLPGHRLQRMAVDGNVHTAALTAKQQDH